MDRVSFLNDVFTKTAEVFISNIPNERKESFRDAYIKYLHKQYDEMFNRAEDSQLNQVASVCVRKEKIINFPKDINAKEAMLFPDKEYLALENLSLEIARLAREKRDGMSIVLTKTKESYIQQLASHMKKISNLYKYTAEKMYSEALVDLRSLFDNESSSSFRSSP